MPNKLVALAMPNRAPAGVDAEALAAGIAGKATQSGQFDVAPGVAWTSLLPYTFNMLWTGFLNWKQPRRPDYFAMIHDDIVPDAGWLDTLIGILETEKADLVSAVVPIKDARGLTSTAIDTTGDHWNPQRLTMTEVAARPVTFGCAHAGGPLLLNTGLWVCRFDAPWCEKVHFRQQDRVVKSASGEFYPQTISEDWDFSRQVRGHGGKILATSAVGLVHERAMYHNRSPWGEWTVDREFEPAKGI